MERFLKLIKTYNGITRLFGAVFTILILGHFTACMWYFIAKLDSIGPDTWVVRQGL